MFKKLLNEIKIIKWPTKKIIVKDCIVTIITSSIIMMALSIINLLSSTLMNFIY